jgi:phosphohistidine swiveling domain-containing protein
MPINKQKELKREYYLQGFNGTPVLLSFGAPSMMRYMYKYLGYGYTVLIDFYDNDKCYYCYAWDDLLTLRDNIISKYSKNKNYLNSLKTKQKAIDKKHLSVLSKIDKLSFSKLSSSQLIKHYQQFAESLNELLGVSHVVEGFTLTCEDMIRALVKARVKFTPYDYNETLSKLTAPLEPSFIGIAHNEIKKAALEKDKKTAILRLVQKYHWLNNGYSASHYLNEDYFIKEIKYELKRGINKEQVLNYEQLFAQNKIVKQKLIKKLNLKQELIDLIEINDFMHWLHDDRKHITTITLGYADNFIKEVATRYKLKHENARYLVQAEINEKTLEKMTNKILAQRREKSIFFSTKVTQKNKNPLKRFEVYTGTQANKFIKKLQSYKEKNLKVLHGNCASTGSATGIIKVCRGAKEITKVKPGDIIVACMTQPEFVPAMKRAAAVITDEGGLTCHAAIISRELKIPCVIGTKTATKVLKDGMKVKIDADNGIIKILK